jgi:hypothetical protein
MSGPQSEFILWHATKRIFLLITLAFFIITPDTALGCSPAPSCWIKSGPDYLRSVCRGYAKDHQTLKEIARYVEEPEKIATFGEACKKLGIHIKAE